MKIKQVKDVVARMFATFIATALGVVGSGALVGVDVAKAALMAGVGACAVVLERLSRSYLEDGVLSNDEINAAFGNDVVDDAIEEAIAAAPDTAQKVRGGNIPAAGALIGAVMKLTGGQADAAKVRELLLKHLGQ